MIDNLDLTLRTLGSQINALHLQYAADMARIEHYAILNIWGSGIIIALMAINVVIAMRMRSLQKKIQVLRETQSEAVVNFMTATQEIIFAQNERIAILEARLGIVAPVPPPQAPESIN